MAVAFLHMVEPWIDHVTRDELSRQSLKLIWTWNLVEILIGHFFL